MPAQEQKDDPRRKADEEPAFLASQQTRDATSWLPWIIAAAVVIVGLGVWIVVGDRVNPDSPSTGTGMAPADPYAASLPISGLQMSEADSFSGAKVTYVDGQIKNTGNRTLTAITVQVGFHSDVGQYAQRLAMPLSLIRTRQPYVDIGPVSAAPIEPGQQRDFRLIFDNVPADWNQQYPEVRVISVHSK
jgi:urease beta subunit